MSRPSKAERLAAVHAAALKRFDTASSAALPGREEALEDRRFATIRGAQWEGAYGDQFANRVKLEANVIDLAVMRVVNEYRMNRIAVDFTSKDGEADDELADLCDGLFRADQQDSRAEEAYDNAFSEAAAGGMGAWRLTTEYEDEYDDDDDRQRIRIEPIYDADTSVFFVPGAKRQDKSDARYAFVIEAMTPEAYEDTWGESPNDWPRDVIGDTSFDWSTPDLVYVAEYYEVEEVKQTVYFYAALDGEEEKYTDADFDRDEGLEETLLATGYNLARQKQVKTRKVRKYILSGGGVLDDCGYIAGKHIPVIVTYGKRWFIDGVERFAGVGRHAKDMQRLKNMQISSVADIAARSSVPKPILTPEQVSGHELTWGDDAVKNYAYLPLNPVADAAGNMVPMGPLGYTQTATIPQATAALLELTAANMEDILGSQESGEQVDTTLSGRAIELVQNRLDMQSYIYMSNMGKAHRWEGEVWLSMAAELYVEPGRKMKYIAEDGTADRAELGDPILDSETGAMKDRADISRARIDVSVEIGPASSSKRAAIVRNLTALMPLVADAEAQTVISAMIFRNMEGEGIGQMRDYFRKKMVALGIEDMTEAEKEEMAKANAAPPQPDPQAILAASLAKEADAKAQKAQADSILAIAKSKEAEANTAETLAGIENDQRQGVLDAVTALRSAGTTAPPIPRQ